MTTETPKEGLKPLELARIRRIEMKEQGIPIRHKNPLEKFLENPTVLKAVHAKCWDCTCGQKEEIRHCTIPDCSLFNYRPFR